MSTNGRSSANERTRVLSRALELREAGHEDWLDRACDDHPELRDDVRAAVMEAIELPSIFVEGAGVDQRVGSDVGGRYEVSRRIGAGAMGVVYEAWDRELDRTVALKVLRPGLMAEERAVNRFEREAQAMAAVVHPAVIAIHDRGRTDDGEAFIVMDLVDGLPLGTIVEQLADRGVEPAEIDGGVLAERLGIDTHGEPSYVRIAVRWIADIAAGLAVSHAAGVVHRDIKPSNIIVRRDGRPVLLDFGVAHLADAPSLTLGGSGVGTPAYMPPESLARERRASNEGDVYGLAAVLYCLLTLRAPYSGSPAEVLFALSSRDPVPLARLHSGLPRDLVAIVEKGMSRRTSSRYASAADLERDLRAFLNHRPVVARPIGPARRVARRALRSKGARGAALALAAVALFLIGTGLRSHYFAGRQARWTELSRAFPPNFTILNHANRVYVHDADREDLARLLDEAVELCVDPLPTHLLRASFRLDHGDVRGAAEDMALIARSEGTPFARELARAYAAVDDGASGSRAVDLADLPAPKTLRDRYLRAYHHVREFEDPEALALLDGAVTSALPHAEEMRFALVLLNRLEPDERHRRALELYADVRRLEQRVGVRTATTAHYLGFALAHMNRFSSALDVCREGIELAPRTHVIRTNAAWAAFALGRVDEAREHLRVASDLRPNDFKPAETLVWTYVAEGDFDGALQAIADVAPELDRIVPWWTDEFSAVVETYRALAERRAGGELLASLLALANEHLDEARASGAKNPAPFAQAILAALAAGSDDDVFLALVEETMADPRRLWRLSLVQDHFPAELGPTGSDAARRLLRALQDELTGARIAPAMTAAPASDR